MDTKIIHLLHRAGFGTNPEEIKTNKWTSVEDVIADLFQQKELSFSGDYEINRDDDRKEKQKKLRSSISNMNITWLREMATTKAVLQEKMTFFWHDHFGVKARISKAGIIHNKTLRKHALGKFGDLLHAIAKDPAMLLFLNNQQNVKSKPNENFARELLELYTLGEGNYTETDIQEAARAFTGWKTSLKGEYRFARFQHDFGEKTVFGQTGNFTGEEVIDIVLEKQETADYITKKIVHFIAGEQVSKAIINELSKKYYHWDYDTSKLLTEIFRSDWFYEKQIIGSKIKSPIELLVGIMRAFPISEESDFFLLAAQRVMGQMLFNPPSVAGWPSGKSWIDSSSLLYRQNLGFAILLNREISTQAKKNFDANDFNLSIPKSGKIESNIDIWRNKTAEDCIAYLFAMHPDQSTTRLIEQAVQTNKQDEDRLRLALLLSLPEFQLS